MKGLEPSFQRFLLAIDETQLLIIVRGISENLEITKKSLPMESMKNQINAEEDMFELIKTSLRIMEYHGRTWSMLLRMAIHN